MKAKLPPQLQEAWARVKPVIVRNWIGAREVSRKILTRTGALSEQAWRASAAGAMRGWVSFRDSWTKPDWFAGIKPLPAGMSGNLTAIAIVTGLVLTSLGYGEYREQAIREAQSFASGEHPSQQPDPSAPAPPSEPDAGATPAPPPVPEPANPGAAPAPAAGPRFPQLGESFLERFSGDGFDPRWFLSDGWSNGSWMTNDWRASQLSLGQNGLRVTMAPGPEGSDHKLASGEIRTHAFYRYGYFEVRMKTPRYPGIVTGVFTYASQQGRTRPNEIDIEILGRNTRVLEATIHENGKPTHKRISLPFDAADGFHSYAFDWQPNAVRWYVDGKQVHEVVGGAAARLTRPQQFMINLWGTAELTDWVGPLDIAMAPWMLDVSCTAYAPRYRGKMLCS